MKIIQIIALLIFPILVFSQKNKVQGAWRALSDFEYTLAESPDISYLMKAKENIDLFQPIQIRILIHYVQNILKN